MFKALRNIVALAKFVFAKRHNKNSVKHFRENVLQSNKTGYLYLIDKEMDSIPHEYMYMAFGPYSEETSGVLPHFKVMGQNRWGSGISESNAKALLVEAIIISER